MSSIRLGEIGKISMCKRILKSQTNEFSGIPFYKISTFGGTPTVYIDEKIYREYKEKYSYPKKGDILISAAGTIGKTVIFDGEASYFQDSNIVWIENDESKVTNQFLYYFLQTNPFITTNGSTIKRLYNDNLRDTKIPNVPSIQQQNQITDILGALDKKIQINNQINQELEAMAKTLYDYWFVQFDFPDQNGKPYKSSGGKMVYHPELKYEIPEGWGVEKLGDISQYVSEKVDSFELNIENYVGTDNMIADMGGIELTTSIPKSGTSTKFSAGDILISNIRPYFKKIWLSDRTGGCSADVLCIRTNRTIPKEFIYATLARDDFFNYDVAGSKGSKMPRGDKKHIMEYPIVFEFGIAEQYSKIVKPIYEGVHENNNQNQELTQLRDWLLPMLMNGQVQVE
ncbi:restriction endonuclease subunit S [Streptococcus symci]|uniref:Restriction endonuclease subunit S n=1 Tax=Streptococcus symci TaxID=2588991 RepID=A0A501PD47_9STRE|nr:restriction endonuclease subunit S [Streptococcus symci]TPD58359.1 restriction endonuclease subunit S [Streptococcus symci]